MGTLLSRADLLAGGFLMTFASVVGQTGFIALSGASVRADLGLSNGAFGGLYSAATLLSGLTIIWLGARVDRVPPRPFALALAAGIGLACLGMSAVTHAAALFLVFYALRLCGQGLLTHLAMTMLARGFAEARGRALAIAGLGFPASEGLVPLAAVAGLTTVGWRMTWLTAAIIALVVLPPVLAFLLRRAEAPEAVASPSSSSAAASLDRMAILRAPGFALLLPCILAPSFVLTAVLFHQAAIVEAKGWPVGWIARCLPAYAACSVAATLLSGVLIDRWGARRLLPLFLLPLTGAVLLLASITEPLLALPAMGLAGATAGSSNTITTAGLAELFGTANLGAVRALGVSAMVVASSLSPGLVGVALDAGVGMGAMLLACAGLTLAAGPLAARAVAARAAAVQIAAA